MLTICDYDALELCYYALKLANYAQGSFLWFIRMSTVLPFNVLLEVHGPYYIRLVICWRAPSNKLAIQSNLHPGTPMNTLECSVALCCGDM